MLPPTSLVICSRNRPQLLLETVQSVLEGESLPTEIVIVDQSDVPHPVLSPEPSERGCTLRYIHSRSIGLCTARNEAIRAAQHTLLVFTDDDMFAAPRWYGTLVRSLVEAGPRSVVTGAVHAGPEEVSRGFVPALVTETVPQVYRGRIGTDVLAAGNMAMWRSAIEEVGPFDERLGAGARFPAADDNEFGFRLLEAGYRIHYIPEAILYHRAWRPISDYLRLRWSYGRGKGGFYAKYASLRDPHLVRRAGRDVGKRLLLFPKRIIRTPRAAVGDLLYILGITSAALEWWAVERRRS